MLGVTCDAFIHTLDECVKLAVGDSSNSLLLLSPSASSEQTINKTKSISEIDQTKFVYQTFKIFKLNL